MSGYRRPSRSPLEEILRQTANCNALEGLGVKKPNLESRAWASIYASKQDIVERLKREANDPLVFRRK